MQTNLRGRVGKRRISHQRGVHCHAWLLRRYKLISEVERGRVLQNLLLRTGGNVQGPRRTEKSEKLEAGTSFKLGAWRVVALVTEVPRKRKGRLSFGSAPDASRARFHQMTIGTLSWKLCASGGWPDLAAPGPMTVAAAPFRSIINTNHVWNISLC